MLPFAHQVRLGLFHGFCLLVLRLVSSTPVRVVAGLDAEGLANMVDFAQCGLN